MEMNEAELYDADIEALRLELAKIDSLYDETKTHFDEVKQHSRKVNGSLSFVHLQTTNLITLKNNKVSILKTIIDTKSRAFMNKVRIATLNKDEGNDDKDDMFSLMEKFIEKFPSNMMGKTINGGLYSEETYSDDEILEMRLAELDYQPINLLDEETPEEELVEEVVVRIISDEHGFVHVIDNDNKRLNLEDYGIEPNSLATISLDDKDPNKIKAIYNDIDLPIVSLKDLR